MKMIFSTATGIVVAYTIKSSLLLIEDSLVKCMQELFANADNKGDGRLRAMKLDLKEKG